MTPGPTAQHQAVVDGARAPWCTGRFNVNLLAIRSDAPDMSNLYDDALVLSYEDPAGLPVCRVMAATTDPGRPYRDDPMRPEGCAVLAPQYAHLSHALGEHRGRPALRQVGPLKAWRVNPGETPDDAGGRVYTLDRSCALNIHDNPAELDGLVDKASAGCLVTRWPRDLAFLLSAVRSQHASGRGDRVSLLLVDVRTTPAAEAARALLNIVHGRTTAGSVK